MQLPDTPSGAMYEEEDRDKLRRDLIEYCTQHCIGSPTLQSRIAAATGRTTDEVNNKTLQRFLAGKHRTNDAFVWLCHKFLLGIDVTDPVKSFGDAANEFFMYNGDPDTLSRALGAYNIEAVWNEEDDVFSEHSLLVLTPVPERAYLRAEEEVGKGHDSNSHNMSFEGVAIIRPNGFSIVLRDILTRRQKWHVLHPSLRLRAGEYAGEMIPPILFGSPQSERSVFRVRMTKAKESET